MTGSILTATSSKVLVGLGIDRLRLNFNEYQKLVETTLRPRPRRGLENVYESVPYTNDYTP